MIQSRVIIMTGLLVQGIKNRIGSALLTDDAPMKMRDSCGGTVMFATLLIITGIVSRAIGSLAAYELGKVLIYVGATVYLMNPIYYNYMLHHRIRIFEGECTSYLFDRNSVYAFLVKTERGELPICYVNHFPMVGSRVRIFMRTKAFKSRGKVSMALYSFEVLQEDKAGKGTKTQ